MKFVTENIINEMPSLEGKSLFHRLDFEIKLKVYLRTRAAEAQNWKCCFCGKHMSEDTGTRNHVTLEHILPLSQGGAKFDFENLAASCYKCNNKRGNQYLMDLSHVEKCKIGSRFDKLQRKYLKRVEALFDGNYIGEQFNIWIGSLSKRHQESLIPILVGA